MDFHQRAQDQKMFNFTPEQIEVERKHVMQFITTKALEMAIKKIETPATSFLLKAQQKAMAEQVLESCQPGLQALLDLDKKVFHVPPHVLLVPDLHLENRFTSEDEKQKTAHLQEMKTTFRENMAMLAHLEAEERKFAAMEDVIQKEIQMQDIANKVCSSFNVSKLSQFCNRVASDEPSASQI